DVGSSVEGNVPLQNPLETRLRLDRNHTSSSADQFGCDHGKIAFVGSDIDKYATFPQIRLQDCYQFLLISSVLQERQSEMRTRVYEESATGQCQNSPLDSKQAFQDRSAIRRPERVHAAVKP